MRTIATVQRILEVKDIAGKDLIGLATFHDIGYRVIVAKNECKADDLVVYFETDALLPDLPIYEFLRKRCFNEKFQRHRIKTMKLKDSDGTPVWSEGLVIPLTTILPVLKQKSSYEVGDDLTEVLDIKEYGAETEKQDGELTAKANPPKSWILRKLMRFRWFRENFAWIFKINIKNKLVTSSWTQVIPVGKTDETRVQNLNYLFKENSPLIGKTLVSTVKMHGSSLTLSYDATAKKNKLVVASRNNAFLSMNVFNAWTDVVRKLKWNEIIVNYAKAKKIHKIVLQGEMLGPKHLGNQYKLKEDTILWFNCWMERAGEKRGRYLTYNELAELLLDMSPILPKHDFWNGYCPVWKHSEIQFDPEVHTLEWFENESVGEDFDIKYPREGLVWRCADKDTLQTPHMGMANQFSFKAINREWSLKNGGN